MDSRFRGNDDAAGLMLLIKIIGWRLWLVLLGELFLAMASASVHGFDVRH
ncbi:hypothetical protein [Calycomorphotria hydatis]|nr:hypothetical protein [Calycomorphotria hydatis]